MSSAKPLNESVSDLRAQIGALGPEDDSAVHLTGLADDIEQRFASSAGVAAPANLGERLTASILRFEGSHPRIAAVLNELAEKLGDIGI